MGKSLLLLLGVCNLNYAGNLAAPGAKVQIRKA